MNLKHSILIRKENNPLVEIEDFSCPKNKITFLFGESGIGKTLITKALYGLIDPLELDVTIDNQSYDEYLKSERVNEIQKNSFFVFQEPSSHLNPLIKLIDQLNEGSLNGELEEEKILESLWNGVDKKIISQIMQVYPKPYRPSGGEKQRVLAAMAFKKIEKYIAEDNQANTLFVFDEPTGNLDNRFRNIFLDMLFSRFQRKQFTAIFITHDYSIISEIYQSHPELVESVEFKELSKNKNGLHLSKFESDKYLHWIDSLKKSTSINSEFDEKIFSVNSGIVVFGRKLSFKKENQTKEELVIGKGDVVYLKAGSGVGKTTIAKIIMGLQNSENFSAEIGGLKFDSNSTRKFWRDEIWGKKITMAFQHADEALNLKSKVRDIFKGLPINSADDDDLLKAKLKELFNFDADKTFLNKSISQLSGGQKQKLNLLRCLVLNTDLLILDEPVSGMDFESIQAVITMIEKKSREGKGILLISHNEEIFDSLIPADRIYTLTSE